MEQKDWAGIFPAITTPFQPDLSVDYETFGAQARWMVECGCRGIVALGSLGEAPTLTKEEKVEILRQARRSLSDKASVIAGIAALSTAEAVWLAKEAHGVGVDGLMVLPPQIYRSDWRETQAHLDHQVQEECGGPGARVRPPRLELAGAERDEVVALTRRSLANWPR